MDARITERLDQIIARLRGAAWKERDAVKAELLAYVNEQSAELVSIKEHLEAARKDLPLELRWEIDEVVEAITPPPPAPPKPPEEEAPAANKPLSASDLSLIYDDPRGLMLYKTKKPPERWFASQTDPRTGQPQTFELHATEVAQLKQQLAGSPYWLLGSGGGAAPAPAAKGGIPAGKAGPPGKGGLR